MKITALRTIALSFPTVCPLGTPYSEKGRMGALAVFIESDQGLTGESVILAVHDRRVAVHAAMVQSFESLLIGRDPTFSEAICDAAMEDASHLGSSGATMMAIGAIDGALLDLRAKLAGLPAHRLLGAARDRVPAYYSSGLWRHVPIDQMLKNAENIIRHGYRAMKMRAGPGNIPEVVERVRRMREAIGYDVKLLIDLGRRFDVAEAIRLGRELEPFQLDWIEETLSEGNHSGEAQIADALVTPLASGESVFSVEEFRHMIETRCVDVLMPDMCRLGGPRQFIRVAHLAEAANIPVSGHVLPEHTLALMASIRNGTYLEVMPWSLPLFADEIRIENGFAITSDKPGWGHALDPVALRKYAVS